MRRWLVLVIGLVAVVALVSVLSSRSGQGPRVVPSPSLSRPAPELAGKTLDGGEYDLDEDPGNVVLVNLWASWCGPCKAEYPVLDAAATELGPRGLSVVGVDTQDKPVDAQRFLQEMGGEVYPSVVDGDGRIAVDWGSFGIPETFVVDRRGIVRARKTGELTPEWIDSHVVPLLDG